MHRFLRLLPLWHWLPAFRAVAETQHLRRAADLILVSPSALSRSIRLLEDALGAPLFVRNGRALRLTFLGEELLTAVRDAMRHVDDLFTAAGSFALGPLRVTAPPAVAQLHLTPVLAALAHTPPGAEIADDVGDRTGEMLVSGSIDLAFGWRDRCDRGTTCSSVGWIDRALCCPPDHPLAAATRPAPERLHNQIMVAVAGEPLPTSLGCRVGLTTHDLASARTACVDGRLLALLPRRLAGDDLAVVDLAIPPLQVFASTRDGMNGAAACAGLVGAVLAAVRDALATDSNALFESTAPGPSSARAPHE